MARSAVLKTDPLIREFVRRSLPRIVKRYAPRQVWLFGSRVRGDWMEYSDLDVVVVSDAFRGIPWPDRGGPLLVECDVRRADVLCYTPEEFKRKRREWGIVEAAVEEGFELLAALRRRRPRIRKTREPEN